jgi:hypothetical protein
MAIRAMEKIITAIGTSDEDAAHLRLLMRKGAPDLAKVWRWGSEVGADLVVVDPGDFAGQMARARAQVSGIRVAVICNAGADVDGDLAFTRPFKLANVIDVLNRVTQAVEPAAVIAPQRQDFYYEDVHDGGDADAAPAPRVGSDVAQGLDEMIRGNPLVDPFANARPPIGADESVTIDAGDGPTRRSEARIERDPQRPNDEPAPVRRYAPVQKRASPEDLTLRPLRDFLAGDLLGGPAQLALPGAAVLVLDPKSQVFHCEARLAALEPYCRESSRRSDWQALTSTEIAQVRAAHPAQPYHKLQWLDAFLRSGGRLASHLDPGGTYKLQRWLDILRDYPRQARISTTMMQPLRLHEIVAASGAEMSEVFDVVNAYDAIGWLEWKPRAPRHGEVAPDGGLSGLVQRLRKPFGGRS